MTQATRGYRDLPEHLLALEKRETSNPERGIMKRELKVLNQRGEVVQEALQAFLLKRKPG